MTLFRIIARLSAISLIATLTVGGLGHVAAFGEQQTDLKASDLIRVKVHNMILDPR